MARRHKRRFTTFNLSFLDIMSCGFGAVVLVFLIIDHSIEVQSRDLNVDLLSEVNMLEEDIRVGQENMVVLRNTLDEVDLEIVTAEGRATRVIDEIEEYEALIASLIPEDVSEDEAVEQLKAELQTLEDEVKKLREAAEEQSGKSARSFVGDGNRQYLTGLNLGGKNIAIMLDVSASMLADKLVN
ncbi:MAG: VWA domain-containing protein, partial [Pseudomonadota bacterium]